MNFLFLVPYLQYCSFVGWRHDIAIIGPALTSFTVHPITPDQKMVEQIFTMYTTTMAFSVTFRTFSGVFIAL